MYSKKVVFWSCFLGILLFGIAMTTLGSIAPDLKEKFGLDDIAAGTLFSILPLGILAGSLLFGPIADKYGFGILLGVSCILLAMGFEGIAFASSIGLLNVCIFLFGMAGGAIGVAIFEKRRPGGGDAPPSYQPPEVLPPPPPPAGPAE